VEHFPEKLQVGKAQTNFLQQNLAADERSNALDHWQLIDARF
jgi:hypothetical protein